VSEKSVTVGAIIGSTLMALSLVGSYGNPASHIRVPDPTTLAEAMRLHDLGKAAFTDGRYQDAREIFHAAASAAMRAGSGRDAAMNWSNAGFAAETSMQYGLALYDLNLARDAARASGAMVPLIYALNNMASLYLQMGAPRDALRISRDALAGPAGYADAGMRARLFYEEAQALKVLSRFPEAEPIFRQAVQQMMDAGDLEGAARGWATLGGDFLDFGRYQEAEWALSESLRLVRTHRLKASANVLSNLAKLRGRQGKSEMAEHLFREALAAREGLTPPWVIYYERGLFRLETGKSQAAMDDFRESRRLAIRMRIDIIPADQDRVSLENYVNRIFEGLVDAGNQVASANGDKALLAETFDAAEQDRLWSLRSLIPEANDWRSHLPSTYWELLARFQSAERSLLEQPSVSSERQSEELQFELQQAEASAHGATRAARNGLSVAEKSPNDELPSQHVREALDANSVLFSFSITDLSSWVWMVDNQQMRVYALPPRMQIQQEVAAFTRAIQQGADLRPTGDRLYGSLFGKIPASAFTRKRWLLEPDGPLYELPFAALPIHDHANNAPARPPFLIERVALQSIPGALLIEKGAIQRDGPFIGIGDPVFNRADARYRRAGVIRVEAAPAIIALPRLPNTSDELEACSRAWGPTSQLLTGSAASIGRVEQALKSSPAVVHFATHVVTASGQFGSGLIALSLDDHGAIGLMGPTDIAANRLGGELVVMNGCHSGQGESLPGSGPMGLTRAWIAAGARAVVATRWDVPDDAAQSLMVNFYRALRQPDGGSPARALREAQLQALRSGGPDAQPSRWAGYFLLSRI
jgi:CHAT domain-containing protein/tetratricopeptide (TPR) repeat protein